MIFYSNKEEAKITQLITGIFSLVAFCTFSICYIFLPGIYAIGAALPITLVIAIPIVVKIVNRFEEKAFEKTEDLDSNI